MSKYIDAEKLKGFVGELKKRAQRNCCDTWGIVPDALEEVEGFIISLQQEQPEFVNEIWHKVSEEANLTRPVVLSDGDKYMSPPCTFPFKDMSGFVRAMNKRYKANYTIWAYMDDLLNISSLQHKQPEVDLEKDIDAFFDKWDKNSNGAIFDENGTRVTIETIKGVVKHFLTQERRNKHVT